MAFSLHFYGITFYNSECSGQQETKMECGIWWMYKKVIVQQQSWLSVQKHGPGNPRYVPPFFRFFPVSLTSSFWLLVPSVNASAMDNVFLLLDVLVILVVLSRLRSHQSRPGSPPAPSAPSGTSWPCPRTSAPTGRGRSPVLALSARSGRP